MSVIGIVLMWVFMAVAFMILKNWPMGKESEISRKYWSKYEEK